MYVGLVHRFCLDAALLGTDKHLLVDGESASWSPVVPPKVFHCTGHVKSTSEQCLDTVAKLAGLELPFAPPPRFVQAMSALSGSITGDVPWQQVMPAAAHQDFIRCLVNATRVVMQSALVDYFEGIWVPGSVVVASLARASIDVTKWQELVAVGLGNVPALKSFQPDADGFARAVIYDRFATLTGRLTVTAGPQILTLKREHRCILRSRHGDAGTIVALDFAALEARVLLYEFGRSCDEPDLYGALARELGHDRKAIKGAVICELYGSSKYALGKHLGIEGKELNHFVKRVKAYFRTSELLARIKAQFVATGFITNRYGRPIKVDEPLDHVLVNHYAQSTGVDVTMLGFHQVIQRLPPRTKPIFLLHDSILLDVHNDDLAEVQKIDNVRVKGYVQKFPLRMEKIA